MCESTRAINALLAQLLAKVASPDGVRGLEDGPDLPFRVFGVEWDVEALHMRSGHFAREAENVAYPVVLRVEVFLPEQFTRYSIRSGQGLEHSRGYRVMVDGKVSGVANEHPRGSQQVKGSAHDGRFSTQRCRCGCSCRYDGDTAVIAG